MKHIMVTGATGFIGSNLVRKLLEKEFVVTAIVRDERKAKIIFKEIKDSVLFYEWDNSISNIADYMKKQRADCVVHLATKYITQSMAEDIDDLVESNITFGIKMLEAMKLAGVRNFINSSTSWQHYQNKEYCPVNVYAATKQAFEDVLKYYTSAEGIRAIILEIYDTYGAFDKRNKIINHWKRISETGESMALSPGEQKLNYVYIEDVVDGIVRAMQILEEMPLEMEGYEAKYALSSDEIYTLKELAQIFEEVYEKKLAITWGGKPYRGREVMEVYRGLERLYGWNVKYNLRSGFQEMWEKERGEKKW